jgi:hypothetical protein
MKEFKQGKLMKVNGEDAWVIASLGVVTADLPQENDMAGILRHRLLHLYSLLRITYQTLSRYISNIKVSSHY